MCGIYTSPDQIVKVFPFLYMFHYQKIKELINQAAKIHFKPEKMAVRINWGDCGVGKSVESIVTDINKNYSFRDIITLIYFLHFLPRFLLVHLPSVFLHLLL
jgi:hypothetical protein